MRLVVSKGADARLDYRARFTARELWGPDAPPRDHVYVDLWDDHLDPAVTPEGIAR